MSRLAVLILTCAAIVAGCVSPSGETPAGSVLPGGTGALMGDAQAIVFTAGQNLSGKIVQGISAASFDVGHDAGEPTLGITADGVLFYAASTFDNEIAGQPVPLPRTDILRSADGGTTWEDVTPYYPGGAVRMHPETGDPMVYVDASTGRVFDIDQRALVGCYTVSYSDDLGDSWLGAFPACEYPPADHQTIVAAKPRLLPTAGYPNMVYVCYNSIATTTCGRSVNGGVSFVTTGPVGTRGVHPEGGAFEDQLCSALVGHLKADSTGTVYLPRRECGVPMVAITRDDGTTWELVTVSPDVAAYNCGGTCGMDPTIAVDSADNVYYVYQGADGHMYLSFSQDQGATWSPVLDVLAPGLTVSNLAAIAGGDEGRIALAYVASGVEGGYDADEDTMSNATWDAYIALITDAATGAPQVTTLRVNDAKDPIVRGACGPGRCNNPGLTDFIDIVVDADGRPWVALVDNCVEKCAQADGKADDSTAANGFVGTIATGPSLRGAKDALLPVIHGKLG